MDRTLRLDPAFRATLDRLGITQNPPLRAEVGLAVRRLNTDSLPTAKDVEVQIVLLPYGVMRAWARRIGGRSLWLVFQSDETSATILAVTNKAPVPVPR